MKKYILENAKFGDRFLTRDGEKVTFIYKRDLTYFCVFEKSPEIFISFPISGKYTSTDTNHHRDIVSKYKEDVNMFWIETEEKQPILVNTETEEEAMKLVEEQYGYEPLYGIEIHVSTNDCKSIENLF